MLKLFLISSTMLFCFLHSSVKAQGPVLPYFQGFEDSLSYSPSGCSKEECVVEFLKGWTGNSVQSNSRIYQDTLANTGKRSIGMIPISSFNPEITLKLQVEAVQDIAVEFYTTSSKNGSEKDTRNSKLFISFSTDNGQTFVDENLVDSFPNNQNPIFQKHHFVFRPDGSGDVLIRFRALRSLSGAGQAAKVILDDVTVYQSSVSGVQEKEDANRIFLNEDETTIYFSRACSGVLINGIGAYYLSLAGVTSLKKADFIKGLYILQVDNGEKIKILIE